MSKKRTAETDATWDSAPSRGSVHDAERRRAARLEAEDAMYGPPIAMVGPPAPAIAPAETWDEAQRRRAARLEAEDAIAIGGPPAPAIAPAIAALIAQAQPTTKPSVEYLRSLSPNSLRKFPSSAFPKTKLTKEENMLPPYNKLEYYVAPPVEELTYEEVLRSSLDDERAELAASRYVEPTVDDAASENNDGIDSTTRTKGNK